MSKDKNTGVTEIGNNNDSMPKFSKEQLLKSNWYSHRRDILSALLDDSGMYTMSEVDRMVKNFLEKKVN